MRRSNVCGVWVWRRARKRDMWVLQPNINKVTNSDRPAIFTLYGGPLPITAKSVATMASAENINCNVRNIQKSTTIRRTPLETPRRASPATARALTRKIRTLSEPSKSSLDPGVMKIGGGGYNDVFLISSVRSPRPSNSS